jgi:general secretion pathway protein E
MRLPGVPRLSRRNYAIAKIACLALGALLVLVLPAAGPLGDLLGSVQISLGMASGIPALLFRGVLALLIAAALLWAARNIWARLVRLPENAPVIGRSDLAVSRESGITDLPEMGERLERMAASEEPRAVDLVNGVISAGFSLEASDIHVSPDEEGAEVKLRVDGNLYRLCTVPEELYPLFVRRVKILSGLPVFRQGVPQDGQVRFEDRTYTARVSVFPTSSGERLAVRLATSRSSVMDLDRIGMPGEMLLDYKALLNRKQGMMVLTGPTGSGKTTTLFASLLHIDRTRGDSASIVTLEDPIETSFRSFHQTQVGRSTGLSFSSGLRSVLRQDPDVIMLGEIRDEETASMAVRAAMTGHLILTTVHASSTWGVFDRLEQMEVDAPQLSSTVQAVLSQRLCRRLCPSCRREAPLADHHIRQLRLLGVEDMPEGPFYEAAGCDECLGKGFVGRVALFEMLHMDDHLRELVSRGAPAHRLKEEAVAGGMRTLLDHGLQLARSGEASLMEVASVVSD